MMMAITSKCRRRREYLSHKLWLKWNIYSCLMFLWAIHQTDLQDTRKESVNKTSTRQPFASKNEESLLLLLLLPSINVHLAYSSCKARLDVKSRLSLRSVIKVYNVFQETEFWSNSKRERERERETRRSPFCALDLSEHDVCCGCWTVCPFDFLQGHHCYDDNGKRIWIPMERECFAELVS